MNFYLDHGHRFQLAFKNGGWDLVVDGGRVHYCRGPREALRYAADELMDDVDADGVAKVVEALKTIDDRIRSMADTIVTHEMGCVAFKYLNLVKDVEDPHECIKIVCLEMSGCQTSAELKADPDYETVIARARALLAPMFAARMSV